MGLTEERGGASLKRADLYQLRTDATSWTFSHGVTVPVELFSPPEYKLGTYPLAADGVGLREDARLVYSGHFDLASLSAYIRDRKRGADEDDACVCATLNTDDKLVYERDVAEWINRIASAQCRFRLGLTLLDTLLVSQRSVATDATSELAMHAGRCDSPSLNAMLQMYKRWVVVDENGDEQLPWLEPDAVRPNVYAERKVSPSMIVLWYSLAETVLAERASPLLPEDWQIIIDAHISWVPDGIMDMSLSLKDFHDVGQVWICDRFVQAGLRLPMWNVSGGVCSYKVGEPMNGQMLRVHEQNLNDFSALHPSAGVAVGHLRKIVGEGATEYGLHRAIAFVRNWVNLKVFFKTEPVVAADKAVGAKRPHIARTLDSATYHVDDTGSKSSELLRVSEIFGDALELEMARAIHHAMPALKKVQSKLPDIMAGMSMRFVGALRETSAGVRFQKGFTSTLQKGNLDNDEKFRLVREVYAELGIDISDSARDEMDTLITSYDAVRSVASTRLVDYVLHAHYFQSREGWVQLRSGVPSATIRTQNMRRLRLVVMVPTAAQVGSFPVLMLFESLKGSIQEIASGKQDGTVLDMQPSLVASTMSNVTIDSIDISGMDASLAKTTQLITPSIAAEVYSDLTTSTPYLFSKAVEKVVYEDVNGVMTPKVVRYNPITNVLAETNRMKTPSNYILTSRMFGEVAMSGETFPSGDFNTSSNHTLLNAIILMWAEEQMRRNGYPMTFVFAVAMGDDIFIAVDSRTYPAYVKVVQKCLAELGLKSTTSVSEVTGVFLQQAAGCGHFLGYPDRITVLTSENPIREWSIPPIDVMRSVASNVDDGMCRNKSSFGYYEWMHALWALRIGTIRIVDDGSPSYSNIRTHVLGDKMGYEFVSVNRKTKVKKNRLVISIPIWPLVMTAGGGCIPFPGDKMISSKLNEYPAAHEMRATSYLCDWLVMRHFSTLQLNSRSMIGPAWVRAPSSESDILLRYGQLAFEVNRQNAVGSVRAENLPRTVVRALDANLKLAQDQVEASKSVGAAERVYVQYGEVIPNSLIPGRNLEYRLKSAFEKASIRNARDIREGNLHAIEIVTAVFEESLDKIYSDNFRPKDAKHALSFDMLKVPLAGKMPCDPLAPVYPVSANMLAPVTHLIHLRVGMIRTHDVDAIAGRLRSAIANEGRWSDQLVSTVSRVLHKRGPDGRPMFNASDSDAVSTLRAALGLTSSVMSALIDYVLMPAAQAHLGTGTILTPRRHFFSRSISEPWVEFYQRHVMQWIPVISHEPSLAQMRLTILMQQMYVAFPGIEELGMVFVPVPFYDMLLGSAYNAALMRVRHTGVVKSIYPGKVDPVESAEDGADGELPVGE